MEKIDRYIDSYSGGRFTITNRVLRRLEAIAEGNAESVTRSVPEVLSEMKAVVERLSPDCRVWNGSQPSKLALIQLKQWIKNKQSNQ